MAAIPNHVEKVIFVAFVVAAVWYEFGPKSEPQADLVTQADVAALQAPGSQIPEAACALYRDALVAGNRLGAWHFADCIAQSMRGSASDRRALQYAVLSLALDTQVNGLSGRAKRDALHASPEEIARADAIDVIGVLRTQGVPDPAQIQN
jgi:hypothetical protein